VKCHCWDKKWRQVLRRLPHTAQIEERPISPVRIGDEADEHGEIGFKKVEVAQEVPLRRRTLARHSVMLLSDSFEVRHFASTAYLRRCAPTSYIAEDAVDLDRVLASETGQDLPQSMWMVESNSW